MARTAASGMLGNAPRVRTSRANVICARQEDEMPFTRPARSWPHRSDKGHMDGEERKVNRDRKRVGAASILFPLLAQPRPIFQPLPELALEAAFDRLVKRAAAK